MTKEEFVNVLDALDEYDKSIDWAYLRKVGSFRNWVLKQQLQSRNSYEDK